jgi:hypothetical protein
MSGLESARLSFHGLLPPALAAVLAALAAVGVFVLYFREHGRVGALRRVLMAILRTAVIAAALFMLLRPVVVAETRGERPRGPALLVDNSLSMTQKDQRLSAADRLRVAVARDLLPPDTAMGEDAAAKLPPETPEDPSRADLVRFVLSNQRLKILEGLRRAGPLKVHLFGQRLRAVDEEKSAAPGADRISAALRNDETRTAVADAILDALHHGEGDPPSAIVVFTDGQDNASRATLQEAALECARSKIPLHLWGVGSSEVGNLELKDFSAPETIFYDDTVSVPVRWRCRGFKQGSAEIILRLGDRAVARREVPVRPAEDLREVLTFIPRRTGTGEERTELAVEVRFKGHETFTDDNAMRRPVSVVDRKVKILYLEDAPRWEYKFLQPALLRDRRVEARFLLSGGDRRTLESGPPYLAAFPATRADLFAFDLLILGDVPPPFVGPERAGWIRDFVREGGSLVVIAGRRNMPSAWHASALAEVLPVEFSPVRPVSGDLERPQPYVPVLTRPGQRAEMLALADTPEENLRAWQHLPPFYWFSPVSRLRPGATALLVHPRQKTLDQPVPVLATHFYGKGQVLFMGTDETWRWRREAESRLTGRFWGQVIYQMGLPHLLGAPKRVQLSLERPENTLGRPCYVFARAFDPEYRPYPGDHITARLEHLDAKAGQERWRMVAMEPVHGQPGEFRALLPHDATGRFAFKVDDPAPAAIEYRVGLPPQHELEAAGMAEDDLRQAAALSGGKFYREEDLHRLAADLAPRKASFTVRHEVLLWNWPVFLVFLGLITLEWVLRKFANLS